MAADRPPSALPARSRLTGVCTAAVPFVVEELLRRRPAPIWLVLTANTRAAERLVEDLRLAHSLSGDTRRLELAVLPPQPDPQTGMREAFAIASARLAALGHLRARRGFSGENWDETLVLVTTPPALFQPVPAIDAIAVREFTLATGQKQPFQELLNRLAELDYDHEPLCEQPGQYAVRGGIVDVYPVTADAPVRIDFFGDEIEELRSFDPVTQRSGEKLANVVLTASPSLELPAAHTGLAAYLGPRTHVVAVDPPELAAGYADELRAASEAHALPASLAAGLAALFAARAGRSDWLGGLFDLDVDDELFAGAEETESWETTSLALHRTQPEAHLLAEDRLNAEQEARRRFLLEVKDWGAAGWRIHFVLPREGEEKRVREILAEEKIKIPRIVWSRGSLDEGCKLARSADRGPSWAEMPADSAGVVLVSETEIFGRHRQRRPSARRAVVQTSQVDQMLDFADLVEGDHVVHLQHGIGIFRGLTRIESGGQTREVLSVEFSDQITLHVPLQESHLLSRYVGLSKAKPTLGKLGSNRWEKTRQAAERATIDLAAQLLEVQAKRDSQPGHAFGPDTVWQQEFEASFPFTETPDQLRAIQDTKGDLEKPRPTDRLICGDVGFGKTEVAIRAAFKAVMGGKQVAVLVPTTVLAQQHFNTFSERMAGYPVVVEMLSRFRTRQEQSRIMEGAATGKIDIVIGTHRLLQRDLVFRDLGLVVIDEEQRFGVKHKEAFKQWRASVDMVSMSATPIPRTLYLALVGARDLSVIETPPVDRLPIQTIVKSYDDKLVTEAIRHEVRRGGQVFYLHNRVQTIEAVAQHLRQLMPEVSVGVGHGQMDETELERVMTDFVAGRYQVLVCTTIIESGLDIPNCNTIIIEGADRFGLSQLYQLRGRVGRFRHQAYAYLLLHRHARLLDLARNRLNAIRQYNQLGAGFRIAMRDLELRGAGNLLGPEQSGHVAGVGFELYCQLLRQSVARLKGEKTATRIRASVKLDFVFVGEGDPDGAPARGRKQDGFTALKDAEMEGGGCEPIQARVPSAYITEARLRIDIYRRLAIAESLAAVRQVEADLKDRFGAFGEEVRALLAVTEIRVRAEQKKILSVETDGNRLKCLRASGRSDDFCQLSGRFPRLTAPTAQKRLREICSFLNNLPNP
ncbi:MAG TPA: transcription-repair coupling factor [Opitutaceae bacterium]|nr:transcription-repair coupling factor [Opitutaceae bacterium]